MNIEQERADFEAWAKGHYILQRSAYNDTYIDVPTMRAWEVWQARAALAAQPAAPHSELERARQGLPPYNPSMPTEQDWQRITENGRKAWGGAQPAASAEPSDEEIDAIAASMPDGAGGMLKQWGYRQFARALLSRYGRPAGDAQPVAWVAADTLNSPHPTCISSLAYMSQLDRERGREYVPLTIIDRYAAPSSAQPAVNGYTCTVPDDCETLHWRGQILSMNELASVARLAASAGPVNRQAIADRFAFLEGVVNEHNYRLIVDTACVLAAQKAGDGDALRTAVMDAIAEALGDAYDCTRVWSAWSYGTMGPDDFALIADDADRLGELADAAIAAMQQQSQENGNG